MPAAIAVPAIMAAVGTGASMYEGSQNRKQAAAQQAQRGVDPATLAADRDMMTKFLSGGMTPDALMKMLSTGPGGQPIGPAPTADISRFLQPDQGQLAAYQQQSPQEIQQLLSMIAAGNSSMTQAGQLSGLSMPQLQAVANYNTSLLGGNKALAQRAIGPQAEMLAEQAQGTRRNIEASGIRGGARDMALAESARTNQGQIGTLIPQAIQSALTSAQGLGTSTAQLAQGATGQAANIFGNVNAADASSREFGIGAEQSNRQMGMNGVLAQLSAALQGRGQDLGFGSNLIQALTSGRGQDLQAMLGLMGVDTNRLGQTDQNYFGNMQNSNNMMAGVGQGAAGFWNLIQNQMNKNKTQNPVGMGGLPFQNAGQQWGSGGGSGIWGGGSYLGE